MKATKALIICASIFVLAFASIKEGYAQDTIKKRANQKEVTINIENDNKDSTLYLVDDKILNDKEKNKVVKNLDPKKIVSIEKVKSTPELIEKYGRRARNGVVFIITTDKGKPSKAN